MQNPSLPLCARHNSAFALISALDAYASATRRLTEHWLDMEAYSEFSSGIDAVRTHGVPMPALTVLSLQLVIAHFELASMLWQNSSTGVSGPAMLQVKERHAFAVNALRVTATRLLQDASLAR